MKQWITHLHTFTPSLFGSVYAEKRVLITGNTGFKGSWLTVWLLKMGAGVYGISKGVPTKPAMFEELGLKDKIEYYETDIRDLESLKQIIHRVKPDFLFHLAAQSLVSVSYADPVETISTNVLGTMNVLEALRTSSHECCGIIVTSDKCYDNVEWIWGYKETDTLGGKDVYSGSKGAAELVFKSYFHSFFKNAIPHVKIASARAGNVIGGGDWALDRIVPDCMRAWSDHRVVQIRSPYATRPWQHVLEPLSGYLELGRQLYKQDDLNGESFNFGPLSQYSHTVKDLIVDLSKYWHHADTSGAYNIMDEIKFHEAGLLKLNCDKALFILKWLPALHYDKLIEFTGKWYFQFYKDRNDMFDLTLSQINEYEQIAINKKIQWTQAK